MHVHRLASVTSTIVGLGMVESECVSSLCPKVQSTRNLRGFRMPPAMDDSERSEV